MVCAERDEIMCVASPGIVIEKKNNIAKVDYNGNIVSAHTGILDVSVGDYVLVHAGMILQKLNRKEAEDMLEIFRELENLDD